MFERLTQRLGSVFKTLTGRGKLNESNIKDALRQVRIALLEADVNLRVVKELLATLKVKAQGERVLTSLTPGQQFIGVVREELTELLKKQSGAFNLPKPATVMLVGLQGAGKTTTAAKLAKHYANKGGRDSLLIAADIQRPAAREQLVKLGDSIGQEVYSRKPFTKDAVGTALAVKRLADEHNRDLIIVDTAGRLQIDDELMVELEVLKKKLRPQAIWLTVDAMTGQEALNVAEEFHRRLELDGVIVSKLDGDARGGCVLSIAGGLGVPIRFVGVGETVNDLESFDAERLSRRVLGMGDVVGLVERAQEVFDADTTKRMEQKLLKGGFDLEDFAEQLRGLMKMGKLSDVVAMVPGFGKAAVGADEEEMARGLNRSIAIVNSMTPEERQHPNIIKGTRRRRIAAGSGVSVSRVNQLLNQYRTMSKTMSGLSGKKGRQRMKQMGLDPGMLGM
ncbi:signal recognition particle protein [bacterium]|nr:signal recognition particle protein [bacterium]